MKKHFYRLLFCCLIFAAGLPFFQAAAPEGAGAQNTAFAAAWDNAGWQKVRRTRGRDGAQTVYFARVERVSDGDSLTLRDNYGAKRKVRMAYIDAPELRQKGGQAARKNLAALVDGRQVEVVRFSRDQYGRDVVKIMLYGEDINLRQIRDGMAWHYRSIARREQSAEDFGRYRAAEDDARARRAGLWQARRPQPPWQWRRQEREKGRQR